MSKLSNKALNKCDRYHDFSFQPCFPDNKGSPVLQQAEVELVDQTLCVSTYGIITSRMLCAGVMSGKTDACRVSHLTCPSHKCFHV